jgi:hypothetical protein
MLAPLLRGHKGLALALLLCDRAFSYCNKVKVNHANEAVFGWEGC